MKKNTKNRFQRGAIGCIGYSIILWSSGCNGFTTNYKLLEREPIKDAASYLGEETHSDAESYLEEETDSDAEMYSVEETENITSLLEAVQHGNVEGLRSLIAKGTCVNTPNVSGLYPLHLAVGAGQNGVKMTELLLLAGADPNVQNPTECTPLYYAVDNEQEEIVQLLTSNRADVHIKRET